MALTACGDDADCSAGTTCTDAPKGYEFVPDPLEPELKACAPEQAPTRVCGLSDTRSGDRQALTRGFQVPAFQLTRADSDRYKSVVAFTWETPRDASVVECALFACRPTVRPLGTEDGIQRVGIANMDACVLALESFEPASGVFDLTNPNSAFVPAACKPSGDCPPAFTRHISELSVGCWAFDTTSLIAATPLEPIDPAGIFNYEQAFDLNCQDLTHEKVCFIQKTMRLGACHAGACDELCVSDADCAPPDLVDDTTMSAAGAGGQRSAGGQTGAGGGAMSAPPRADCVKSGNFIGVCLNP